MWIQCKVHINWNFSKAHVNLKLQSAFLQPAGHGEIIVLWLNSFPTSSEPTLVRILVYTFVFNIANSCTGLFWQLVTSCHVFWTCVLQSLRGFFCCIETDYIRRNRLCIIYLVGNELKRANFFFYINARYKKMKYGHKRINNLRKKRICMHKIQ
jgi:hypothetical protein